jgi:hypothetical protein
MRPFIYLLVLTGLALNSALACATTTADLLSQGRLQLRTWLVPAQDIVPGQQVKLNLEIATDRWFTGGTRIRIPEVPGLVILQTDEFASNSSERRNGQSWVIQRWALEVYPQRDGNFSIPPVTARIKVSDEGDSSVEGEIEGPALQFSAARPEGLARVQHWVAAPGYTVSQSFNRDLAGLKAGDAIEREIVFEANEVMAMMLPAFKEAAIPGLAAYPGPPELQNRSNRGTTVASRRERITYIVEAEGEFQLPAQDFFWWDTSTGELQVLSLATVNIVAGTAAQNSEDSPQSVDLLNILPWVGGLAALGVLIWLVGKLPGNTLLQRVRAAVLTLWQQIQILRKPALPERLNPGNSGSD